MVNNTYEILKSVLSGNTLTINAANNTYEVLNAVYDETNSALRVTIDGGIHSLSGMTAAEIAQAIASAVIGGVYYQGGYNPVTNVPDLTTPSPTTVAGFMWTCTSAGTFFTQNVEVGDSLIAAIDSPTVETDWVILQTNLDAGTVKTLYESNADTNCFTDANVLTLGSALQPGDALSATTTIGDLNGYTTTECDANFLSANTALFDGSYNSLSDVPDFDSMYLSASTTVGDLGGYTSTEINNLITALSADTALQSDWEETDNTLQSYIDNKPDLFTLTAGTHMELVTLGTDITMNMTGEFLSANTALFDGSYNSLSDVPDFDTMYLSANTSLFDGNYNNLSNLPTLVTSYNDLTDLPSLFDGSYNNLTDVPDFATMFLSADTALFDGEYSSLTNVPDFDSMYLSASTTTLSTSQEITLSAASWSTNSIVVTVPGVLTTNNQIISIEDETNGTKWANAEIYGSVTDVNEMTFTCQTEPTEDITIKIIIL